LNKILFCVLSLAGATIKGAYQVSRSVCWSGSRRLYHFDLQPATVQSNTLPRPGKTSHSLLFSSFRVSRGSRRLLVKSSC